MKGLLTHLILAILVMSNLIPLAKAEALERSIPGQILRINTNWGSDGETLKVKGLVQIPKDVTLTIQAGTTLDVREGSFLVLGTLKVGGPEALSTAKLSYGWFDAGSYQSNIHFFNTIFLLMLG